MLNPSEFRAIQEATEARRVASVRARLELADLAEHISDTNLTVADRAQLAAFRTAALRLVRLAVRIAGAHENECDELGSRVAGIESDHGRLAFEIVRQESEIKALRQEIAERGEGFE